MKIKAARRIDPVPSRCIEVNSPDRLFAAGGVSGASILSHNSVVQRNLVFGCILRPDSWRFLGIDLKRVELSVYRGYSNVVLGIATTLEDAITVLRFAQQTMMRRYSELEQLGLNNFLDLPNKGQALMVMVDEAGELLGSSGVKALGASTYIPNLNGRRNLQELQIGDIVFDNHGRLTRVEDKYSPESQEQYDLVFRNAHSVSSGRLTKETLRSGAAHYWVVTYPDEVERTVTTSELFEAMKLFGDSESFKVKRVNAPLEGIHQDALPVTPSELGEVLRGVIRPSQELIETGYNEAAPEIPPAYLYGSVEQRETLLRSVFAGDSKFLTNDLYLVQDLQRLIAGLGLEASLSEPEGADFVLEISYGAPKSPWFEIESLTPVDEDAPHEELYCIRVDAPESQFLASENAIPTHNTDEGKEQDMLKGEASMIIGSVARLGRAAGVHLVIATQRPDATLIPGETKANLGVRINAGRTDSNASSMILGSGEGTRVKANPRGRLYLSIYGRGDHGHGFFAPQTWIDEYLASKGLNPDGSPLSQRQSRLATVRDMSEFGEGADLDSREGIDNSAVIDRIRQDEESGVYEEEENWGFEDVEEAAGETASKERDDSWGGLELSGKADNSKTHRPEDDWDDDLDQLIEDNFSK